MGLATARAFAEALAVVALADVNEAAVRAAAEGLFAGGRKATSFSCNVADEADVSALVKQTVARFGRWMQHSTMPACSLQSARPPTTSGEDFDRVNAINLRGVSSDRCASRKRRHGQLLLAGWSRGVA